jgi:hypothetical protein
MVFRRRTDGNDRFADFKGPFFCSGMKTEDQPVNGPPVHRLFLYSLLKHISYTISIRPIMKIWTGTTQNDDRIIAYSDGMIYKLNPPLAETNTYVEDLRMKHIPVKHIFGIPLHYLSEINLQEGKNYIEVLFKGDTEHLKVSDGITRNEIFEFFKTNIPDAHYSVVKQTKIQAIKKPVIALIVMSLIFLWSLYIAIGKAGGNDYDVTGQHYNSIAGIVLVLAALGIKKLSLIFGTVFLLVGYSIVKKYKHPVVKDCLRISH